MSEIPKITQVDAVLYGVLKLTWDDGYSGIVDLRPVLGDGEAFAFLRNDPKAFDGIQRDEFGHCVFWIDPQGRDIDIGSWSLRQRAERQAEILRLAS